MRKLLATCMLFLLLSSCKKETASADETTSSRLTTLPEVKAALMKEILLIAKDNPEFRKAVESECLKQVRGDYNVALDRILEMDKANSIIPQVQKLFFTSLVNQMKEFRPGEMPIIFVPVMESRDPSVTNKRQFLRSSESETITAKMNLSTKPGNQNSLITMVDQANEVKPSNTIAAGQTELQQKANIVDPEDPGGGGGPIACTAPYYYAGYIIDNSGNLTYSECIDEAFAWTHDVWVLGYEEVVSPGNQIASPEDPYYVSTNGRYEDFAEHAGLVQLTDMGAIEPWVQGKLEFRYTVHNAFGTLIKERAFGKRARRNFDGQAWHYLNDFLGYWNTSVWGPVTYERWIEEDGGVSNAFIQNISYTINGVSYTTTISVPARDQDDNLGMANIQFSDNIFFVPLADPEANKTIYTLTNMNVQRQHY